MLSENGRQRQDLLLLKLQKLVLFANNLILIRWTMLLIHLSNVRNSVFQLTKLIGLLTYLSLKIWKSCHSDVTTLRELSDLMKLVKHLNNFGFHTIKLKSLRDWIHALNFILCSWATIELDHGMKLES